jgi:L-alanine-DL-glutamate epimerase-like enolase superfamily enzyme
VTEEDQPDVLETLTAAAKDLIGARISEPADLDSMLAPLEPRKVARGAMEMALLDALARSRGLPVARLFRQDGADCTHLVTDVTIPILPRDEMQRLARKWYARGFSVFKLKVGRELEEDLANLAAIVEEVPGASYRVDANGGYTADAAITFTERALATGARIECFEQPCAREDVEGQKRVRDAIKLPVIADESVRSLAELEALHAAGACDGVNLKIVKVGGVARAIAIGRRAKELGLRVMVGGMVETRVGMTAGAHVAAALGGVDFVDLDTAFLLASDPFVGGYRADGPKMQLDGEGLGVFEAGAVPVKAKLP